MNNQRHGDFTIFLLSICCKAPLLRRESIGSFSASPFSNMGSANAKDRLTGLSLRVCRRALQKLEDGGFFGAQAASSIGAVCSVNSMHFYRLARPVCLHRDARSTSGKWQRL